MDTPHARVPEFAARLFALAREIETYVAADLAAVDTKPGRRSYYESLDFEARHAHYIALYSAAWRAETVARQLTEYVGELFELPALRLLKVRDRRRDA